MDIRNHFWAMALCSVSLGLSVTTSALAQTRVRPPAVPLVTHDPYFSVWSFDNKLTENWTHHWTGSIQAMCGLAMIDRRPYRFAAPNPDTLPAMEQTNLEVTPTRTTYTFVANGVQLKMNFLSPLLTSDIDLLSRPVTYITFSATSADGRQHSVSIYFDVTGEWAVNRPNQQIRWDRWAMGFPRGRELEANALSVGAVKKSALPGTLEALSFETVDQPVLKKAGDNLRIDWGQFYLVVPTMPGNSTSIASDRESRDGFATHGNLTKQDDTRKPRAAEDQWPVLAAKLDLGKVGKNPVQRHVMLAYDDRLGIELLGKQLKPYWRRNGLNAEGLLLEAEKNYASITKRCDDFDKKLTADLKKMGGVDYANLCILAYRQCLAANKVVAGPNGEPLQFPKENFSNGCISTVDVIYPAAPFFLLLSPELLKSQLTPVLDYAVSSRWKFPFAPHDLGTYPLANGQVYGGGERNEIDQMPVEESGNMLLMLAALAKIEGNAKYAEKYWPTLTKWAEYLKAKGLDPENQLCTDDFAGHLAHNTNLSLKAILALAGYSQLAKMAGHSSEAMTYLSLAKEMASKWVTMAKDGDHYRLTFDKPNTWSQKYNLVWDKLLGLNIFPAGIARTETAFYLKSQNKYGLPLDNRSKYTKLDWTVWTATMAESEADFKALVAPLMGFANESTSRVPLSDWFWTNDAKMTGFQARSVVGGVYIKMLADPAMWKKWAK
ncbi:MAG: DUF4965 domain-containing protein [Chthonomonadales bacterium]